MPDNIKEIISRKLKSKNRAKYSPELRSFALSLQFYSSRAYNYVRKIWKNLLPHPSTLRAWYSVINGKPGFTSEAFEAICAKNKEKRLVLNLVLDEMSIREQIVFETNRFYGGVDMVVDFQNPDNDNIPMARNALVFLAVAVNGGWKVPVGYFLIKSFTGSERANLLTHCLKLLAETGAEVQSITFDGAPSYITMCTNSGADFKYGEKSFKPWIVHPVNNKKNYIFYDVCHMIKLIRNCLGDKSVIIDGDNNKICWLHISELNRVQNNERLHLATKITNKHINYDSNRMNVKLAAQTLSESVCNALLYLKDTNYSIIFKDAAATANFCKQFNNIFDILNTKNKFEKKNNVNLIINDETFEDLKSKTTTLINYIVELKDPNGVKMIHGARKTGFLGLIINLTNIFDYFYDIKNHLQYLLTFKLSQDFIKTFFSACRSRGGFNNNPNAKQFESAYKRLLLRHEIKMFDTSNCLADGLDILHVSSKRSKFLDPIYDNDNVISTDIFDHDYVKSPDCNN